MVGDAQRLSHLHAGVDPCKQQRVVSVGPPLRPAVVDHVQNHVWQLEADGCDADSDQHERQLALRRLVLVLRRRLMT